MIKAFSDEKLGREVLGKVSRCPSLMAQGFFNEGGSGSANMEGRINIQILIKNFSELWDRFLFCPVN